MADTRRCGHCPATIPTVVQYDPIGDGSEFIERHVVDNAALLAHLTAEHPTVVRVHYTERWATRA